MASEASRLAEKLKTLDAVRKKTMLQMKKAEEEEKRNKFINAGKDLFEHFKTDPLCKESSELAAICKKYFVVSEVPVEGKENATGMDIASKTKK